MIPVHIHLDAYMHVEEDSSAQRTAQTGAQTRAIYINV